MVNFLSFGALFAAAQIVAFLLSILVKNAGPGLQNVILCSLMSFLQYCSDLKILYFCEAAFLRTAGSRLSGMNLPLASADSLAHPGLMTPNCWLTRL